MTGVDSLCIANLTIQGITQGGVETCIRVPELKLMFDVGRCSPGAVSGKYSTILISHGHADHLGGLPYLVSQRSMMNLGPPQVHVPQEIIKPLRTILDCWSEIEDFKLPVDLVPHVAGDVFAVGKNLEAIALRSVHRVPSLAYIVQRITSKLKIEFTGWPRDKLIEKRNLGIAITQEHRTPLLCVTGDTQIEFFANCNLARRCSVLVHEVTSWDDQRDVQQTRHWGHTHIDEMIAHAEQFEGEALVLVHRSMRHTRKEAEKIVRTRFPASVRDKIYVFGN